MEPLVLTEFELGQIVAVLGPNKLAQLTPDLRQKLLAVGKKRNTYVDPLDRILDLPPVTPLAVDGDE